MDISEAQNLGCSKIVNNFVCPAKKVRLHTPYIRSFT